VHDFIADDGAGGSYLIMGFVNGSNLADHLAAQPDQRLDPAAAVTLIAPIASALVELHARGILHRDLKPANIVRYVRADGRASVKLVDFGIARREQDAGLTGEGLIVGTPPYLSPEVMLGKRHSEASDVYALGATLFELLAGTPPFGKDSVHEVMRRTVSESVRLPEHLERTPVGELLLDLLDRNEARRPTALAALGQLERLALAAAPAPDVAPRSALPATLEVAAVPGDGGTTTATPTAIVRRSPSSAIPTGPDAGPARSSDGPRPGRGVHHPARVPWAIACVAAVAVVVLGLILILRKTPAPATSEPRPETAAEQEQPRGRPGRPTAEAMTPRALDRVLAPRVGAPPDAGVVALAELVPGPDVAPADLARARKRCSDAPAAYQMFNEANALLKYRAHAAAVKVAFTALLACPHATPPQQRWSAMRLARVYVREKQCDVARRLWERYQALARATNEKEQPFPACP
jgi:hypothetical protein